MDNGSTQEIEKFVTTFFGKQEVKWFARSEEAVGECDAK